MWNDLLPWQQSLHSNSMKTCWQRQCPLNASGYSFLFVRAIALIAEVFTHTHTHTHAHAHTSLSVLPSNIDCPFSVRSPITRPLNVLLCLDRLVEEGKLTFLKASFSSYYKPVLSRTVHTGLSDDCPYHKWTPLACHQKSQTSDWSIWLSTGPVIHAAFQQFLYIPPTMFQALSRSLYFLRRTDTWSLKSTGSRRNWEWTRGM